MTPRALYETVLQIDRDECENMQVVRAMLQQGVSPNYCEYGGKHGHTALREAIRKNNLPLVGLLVRYGADLTQTFLMETPIQYAASLWRWDCVRTIAETRKRGARDNARYGEAVHTALEQNELDVALCLLEKGGANVYPHTVSMMADSSQWNCLLAVSHYLFRGDYYLASLRRAVQHDRSDVAYVLLKAGTSLNVCTKHLPRQCGEASFLLHIAENVEMMVLLLSFGIYPYYKNSGGLTARDVSIGQGKNFDEALMMHNQAVQLRKELLSIIQLRRIPGSSFYGLSNDIFNLIFKFLDFSRESSVGVAPFPSLQRTQNFLTKVSAKCFVEAFPSKLHQNHTPQAEAFFDEMKGIVKSNANSSETAAKVRQSVGTFMGLKPCLKSRTVGLLFTYHLAEKKEEVKKEENKNPKARFHFRW